MNKRFDWFLYTPPEIWNLMIADGMLQAVIAEQRNFFTEIALADIQGQLEGFLAVRKAFWEGVQRDDHSNG